MYNYFLILLWMILLLLIIHNNTFINNTKIETFNNNDTNNDKQNPIIYTDDSDSEIDGFDNPKQNPFSCDSTKDPLCKYANVFLNSNYN